MNTNVLVIPVSYTHLDVYKRQEYDQVQMQKIQEEEEARAAADTALENKLQTNINN